MSQTPVRERAVRTSGPDAPAIEAVGVVRAYGTVRALDHVGFAVPRHVVCALVGPPGCGKSTLLRVVVGLLAPDEGHTRVLGLDPAHDASALRARVGWLPAHDPTWDALTPRQALTAVGAAHGLDDDAAGGRADELLDWFGLESCAHTRARGLETGARRRLALAQALVHSPDVLVLDEPAAGLEVRDRLELSEFVHDLTRSGVSVLAAARTLDDLGLAPERVLEMEAGRVIAAHDDARVRTVPWRVTALDVSRLRRALTRRGSDFIDVAAPTGDWGERGAVDVDVADERDAAALLGFLVADGVAVFGFGPATTERARPPRRLTPLGSGRPGGTGVEVRDDSPPQGPGPSAGGVP